MCSMFVVSYIQNICGVSQSLNLKSCFILMLCVKGMILIGKWKARTCFFLPKSFFFNMKKNKPLALNISKKNIYVGYVFGFVGFKLVNHLLLGE